MKRVLFAMLAGLFVLGAAGLMPVLSQDMGGDEACAGEECGGETTEAQKGSQDPNGVLKKMLGRWDMNFSLYMEPGKDPIKMKFVMKNEWALDEQFIKADYDMKEGPIPHKGIEYFSYNEATQEYEAIRITSASGSIIVFHGKYDEKTKTLEMKAEYKMAWAGAILDVKGRNVYKFESADKHTFTGYSEYVGLEGVEGEMKEVEITFDRKKTK